MEVSIDEPLNVDWDGNELLLSDILGTDSDVISKDIEDEIDRKMLNKAMETLSDREKLIIRLRFGIGGEESEEKTQKEVADLLGISQGCCRQGETHRKREHSLYLWPRSKGWMRAGKRTFNLPRLKSQI